MKDKLHHYFKKRVEMKSRGILYKGLLIGADEDLIYLKAKTTWITIPIDEVTSIRKEGDQDEGWLHKEIPGEPKQSDEDRAGKKTYPDREFEKIHLINASVDWPDSGETK